MVKKKKTKTSKISKSGKPRTKFVHLHVHSRMSTSDGLNSFEDIAKRAKDIGQDAIAITDHYYMYDVPTFYYCCHDEGIEPIIGCEFGILPEGQSATLTSDNDITDEDKNTGKGKKKKVKDISYFHGTFIAKNYEGYINLMKLASIGNQEDRFYRKPRITRADIKKHRKGLIFMSACLGGEIPRLILAGKTDYALKVVAYYRKLFGDDFYLEIQDHGIEDQEKVNKQLIAWAREYNLNLVLTNDTHYTTQDLAESHRLLLCANWGNDFYDKHSDVRTKYFPTDEFYIKTDEEMYEIALKYDAVDAYENTYKIKEKCHIEIPKTTHYPPAKLKLCDDGNPDTELKLLIEERKWNKYVDKGEYVLTSTGDKIPRDVFDARLKKELGDIKLGKVADYFLNVCYGITDYCRDNDILIGAGRGSAAGSVVSYILNITDTEPIALNLTWERFWNPGRMKFDEQGNILEISMPDIDLDIPSDRREEVMEHCKEYWGYDCVSSLITFGTWSGKNLVKAVGKSMRIDEDVIDECCKYIPMSLSGALKNSSFLEYLEDNDDANDLIEACKPLEGCVRNASSHAAGLLICDAPLYNYTPTCSGKNGVTSQYPFETMEKLGCLKVDLLGHEAEVIIDNACKYIQENHGVTIIPREIPITDKKTFKMLQQCDMRGVPQLENEWVLPIIQDVHPETLAHIIDLVTMIRPGSLDSGQTDKYREIRKGLREPAPDIPQVEHITEETYGCWLYQEQIMDVVKDIAAFTLGQADDLRKVVAKTKYADKAEKLMTLFKENGMAGKGKTPPLSQEQWEHMDKVIRDFFKYAFNKAHSAGYGTTSYRCAYLKANYFIEYMTALLNSKAKESLPFYLNNIYEHGYVLDLPDINISEGYKWTCKDGKLRPPLCVIKDCGPSCVDAIIEERELNGDFETFEDFLKRTPSKNVKKNSITSLICAGAFVSMGYTRKDLYEPCENEDYAKVARNDNKLISSKSGIKKTHDEYTIEDIKADEEYLMGFEISLTEDEVEKRRRSIYRKVKQYREYVYHAPKPTRRHTRTKQNKVTEEDKQRIADKRQRVLNKISHTLVGEEEIDEMVKESIQENVEKIFINILVNTKTDSKILPKIFKIAKEQESSKLPKNHVVTFIVETADDNRYKLDTKLEINVKAYVRISKLLGADRIWVNK